MAGACCSPDRRDAVAATVQGGVARRTAKRKPATGWRAGGRTKGREAELNLLHEQNGIVHDIDGGNDFPFCVQQGDIQNVVGIYPIQLLDRLAQAAESGTSRIR